MRLREVHLKGYWLYWFYSEKPSRLENIMTEHVVNINLYERYMKGKLCLSKFPLKCQVQVLPLLFIFYFTAELEIKK